MGFWQIPISPECRRLLTTFITPLGRFHFNKLLFQSRMSVILEGLEGVLCLVYDVLVFGTDQQEHDSRLRCILEGLNKARITLNAEKCAFSRREIKFLGHVINQRCPSFQTLTRPRRFRSCLNPKMFLNCDDS